MSEKKSFKSGFVSLIGRPNVGKSTLVNALVGEKVSIMSDKPQTTRKRITAVYTDQEMQLIFLDTPGIQKPRNKLGEFMLKASSDSMKETDIILLVVDDSKEIGRGDREILENLRNIRSIKMLAVNKIDKITKEELAQIVRMYDEEKIFDEIIPVSALKGTNQERLRKVLASRLSEGPQYFPEDMLTDQPEKVLIAEIIREKLLLYTDKEVPHGIAVEIESMKVREQKEIFDISAVIYCERESHKKIIIGREGRKLKGVGKSAREELEHIFGTKINLQLWVKVKENWRDRENYIRSFGFREE